MNYELKKPRGIRNNNPLNIRHSFGAKPWQGQRSHDGKFCIFDKMEMGYRAGFILLNTYNQKYQRWTVIDIIHRWAPPKDHNNTRAYVERVCQLTGLHPTSNIVVDSWVATQREEAIRFVWAMAKVENGDAFVTEADMETVRRGYELAFPKHEKQAREASDETDETD